MSNKKQMMMNLPINAPSYEEATGQSSQTVMMQPQPVFNPVLNAQPGYPQPGYPQPGYPQPGYPQPSHPQAGYPQPGFNPPMGQPIPPVQPQMQTTIIQHIQLGNQPVRITCPSCKYEIETKVESVPAMKTHIIAGILCILGCWCCACCPYCMESCQSTNHNCPNCGAFIGSYNE